MTLLRNDAYYIHDICYRGSREPLVCRVRTESRDLETAVSRRMVREDTTSGLYGTSQSPNRPKQQMHLAELVASCGPGGVLGRQMSVATALFRKGPHADLSWRLGCMRDNDRVPVHKSYRFSRCSLLSQSI